MKKHKGQDIFNFLIVILAIVVMAGAVYVRFIKPELLATVVIQDQLEADPRTIDTIVTSTVTIQGRNFQSHSMTSSSSGSGFFIDKYGHILTNEHVVNGCEHIYVVEHSGRKTVANIISTDKRLDLAILKIESNTDTPYLFFGNSDQAKAGQGVIAAGNPYNNASDGQAVITFGRISRLREQCSADPDFSNDRFYDNLIQFDASVYPGSSGGPLLNLDGKVIGIVVAVSNSSRKTGYAIGLNNYTRNAIATLHSGQKMKHGFLGTILHEDIPIEIVNKYKLNDLSGACISDVLPGSPAAAAGLISGDIIIAVDNKQIYNRLELMSFINSKTAKDEVKIRLLRPEFNGIRQLNLKARLESRSIENRDGYFSENKLNSAWGWGIQVKPISTWRRNKEGIPNSLNGLLVWEVKPDSLAHKQGLKTGDIITAINGKTISNLHDFEQIAQECLFSPRFELWSDTLFPANTFN
ncbi:MAG: trypsin-like peptidase domain-containing protein [Sedimentisphaerales bacterium]|nr:trypsin-like peptidase domain-containing protein [Sedimentisphaerales bacterium]MBN2842841.1 trypsin-like peptidase domain-containing protein [Sedimentisphaerales bacterium]